MKIRLEKGHSMKKRYTAALIGQGGMFKALRRVWATRFARIEASILIPEEHEKLRLYVHYDAKSGEDIVTLLRENYRTGHKSKLYAGRLKNGIHIHPPHAKD